MLTVRKYLMHKYANSSALSLLYIEASVFQIRQSSGNESKRIN